jgi:hypothetical protein
MAKRARPMDKKLTTPDRKPPATRTPVPGLEEHQGAR